MNLKSRRSSVELNTHALVANIAWLKNLAPDSLLAPCVKSNAYGHGLTEITRIIIDNCVDVVDYLCVQAPWEGRIVREAGWQKPIMNISVLLDDEIDEVIASGLEVYISDPGFVVELNQKAKENKVSINVHLLVDTGMCWQGVQWQKALDVAQLITNQSNLKLKGVTTHFGNSDEPNNRQRYDEQKVRFLHTKSILDQHNIKYELFHCANSGSLINDPRMHFDLVQPGISVYGLSPSRETSCYSPATSELQPVLSWKSSIAYINHVPAGEWIGYGQTIITTKPTTLAIIPVGYYDGYSRLLGNKASVLIGGKRRSIVGRVCMNLMMVDITDTDSDCQLDDEVVLIGRQGDEYITADELAHLLGTINYEIVTRINAANEGLECLISS